MNVTCYLAQQIVIAATISAVGTVFQCLIGSGVGVALCRWGYVKYRKLRTPIPNLETLPSSTELVTISADVIKSLTNAVEGLSVEVRRLNDANRDRSAIHEKLDAFGRDLDELGLSIGRTLTSLDRPMRRV